MTPNSVPYSGLRYIQYPLLTMGSVWGIVPTLMLPGMARFPQFRWGDYMGSGRPGEKKNRSDKRKLGWNGICLQTRPCVDVL